MNIFKPGTQFTTKKMFRTQFTLFPKQQSLIAYKYLISRFSYSVNDLITLSYRNVTNKNHTYTLVRSLCKIFLNEYYLFIKNKTYNVYYTACTYKIKLECAKMIIHRIL